MICSDRAVSFAHIFDERIFFGFPSWAGLRDDDPGWFLVLGGWCTLMIPPLLMNPFFFATATHGDFLDTISHKERHLASWRFGSDGLDGLCVFLFWKGRIHLLIVGKPGQRHILGLVWGDGLST